MGQGVGLVEHPHITSLICPVCGSILWILTELPPQVGAIWDQPTSPTPEEQFCQVCGTDLGILGYGQKVYDRSEPKQIVCPNPECGVATLVLWVSPTLERNVDQYCPVCGTLAD